MSGKLTDTDKDALEMWIGSGPKKFTLLYSITKDGCDGTTFHQKCNQQGPTVVVLYNQQGSVFGGYTSQHWASPGDWSYGTDTNAFMYQLHFSGQKVQRRFGIKKFEKAIYNHRTYGPLFGAGHDLYTFSGNITPSGGVYALNGKMVINDTYDTQGLTADKINNGSMDVTELEVYQVTDGQRSRIPTKPWRNTAAFDEKFLGQLKEDLRGIKPGRSSSDLSQFRILMFGPMGSGKSSFYNTINSVFRGRISQPAVCGESEHGITTKYNAHQVIDDEGATLNFTLCDTYGLQEQMGLDMLECNFLLGGHIKESYKFSPLSPSPEFIAKPAASDKIHCVVFVVDASRDLPEAIVAKMKNIQKQIHQKELPQVLLFTKIDKLVSMDMADVFSSGEIQAKVEDYAKMFGLTHNNIWPIKNYEQEIELDDSVSILSLLALRHILNMASDQLQHMALKSGQFSASAIESEVCASDTA